MRDKLKALFTADWPERRKILRYLLAGGFNTAFGYGISVALYHAFAEQLHIVIIGLIANAICITEAFFMYKLLVFRSAGGWWQEYLKCFTVYGGSALTGIAGLWLFVTVIGVPFWIAQGVLMIVGIVISYIGHDRFTFKRAQRG